MRTVFVDTSGFYALLNPEDMFHEQARALFRRAAEEGWTLVTTNYVVHESWALIQGRLGWEALDAWRHSVLPHCRTDWVDEDLFRRGEARCIQARERRLSLTDCLSLEFMRQHRIREAIGRDDHFERAGIVLPA